jgi:hypothetical protein
MEKRTFLVGKNIGGDDKTCVHGIDRHNHARLSSLSPMIKDGHCKCGKEKRGNVCINTARDLNKIVETFTCKSNLTLVI